MARCAICMWVLWTVSSSACAYAQTRSVSQGSQVVLIARLPDTFAVNSLDTGALATGTPLRASPAGITLHASGQLIPGTSATTACSVRNSGEVKIPAVSRTGGLTSERRVSDTLAVESSCDGSFRVLNGSADSIAIQTRDRSSGKAAPGRLDVIFSIL